MISYVLWVDGINSPMEVFAGPHRLARWPELPAGWGVERFMGDVSQGMVTLAEVRADAADDLERN